MISPIQIMGPEELSEFRSYWNGRRVLDLLRENGGKVLINWQIGVGKSTNIDSVIEEAAKSQEYDLVIALLPTRDVLNERKFIVNPPPGIKVVNLRPRPAQKCGDARNLEWKIFEKQGLGLLGRKLICSSCPERKHCFWPTQYSSDLRGAQVIFATQAHLEIDPAFLIQLSLWAGAESSLVVLDEVSFITKKFQKQMDRADLVRFVEVLNNIE